MSEEDKSKKTHLLVLSIFKGFNFVWREAEPLKCKVRAVTAKNALNSKRVEIGHGVQDPEFNAQLVWGFTKKEFSTLKQQKASIRVECLSEKKGVESSIGYFIVKVADALPMEKGIDYGPTHSNTISLLGLKDYWKQYSPKVQALLHLEIREEKENRPDSSSPSSAPTTNKSSSYFNQFQQQRQKAASSKSAEESKKAPSSPRQIQTRSNDFTWHVNEKDGYFELGPKNVGDDLYVLTITVVDGSYFHLLSTPQAQFTESPETFNYVISYEAFGLPITSDPFILNSKEDSRMAFIGDKTTARIRANSALFHEYLLRTSFETKLLRSHQATSEEILNHPSTQTLAVTSFTLRDLGRPGVNEKNFILELISQHGPDISSGFKGRNFKPVLRLVASLQACPDYFNEKNLENPGGTCSETSVATGSTASSILLKNGVEEPNGTGFNERTKKITFKVPEKFKSDESESDSFIRDVFDEVKLHAEFQDVDFQIMKEIKSVVEKNKKEFEMEKEKKGAINALLNGLQTNKVNVNQDETVVILEEITKKPTEETDGKDTTKNSGDEANLEFLKSQTKKFDDYSELEEETITSMPDPSEMNGDDGDLTTSYSSVASPERRKLDFNPGKYKLSICLKTVWLKSKRKCFELPLSITYTHPPFGMIDDVSITAVPNYNQKRPNCHAFDVTDKRDRIHRVILNITKLTDDMVKKPLILEFKFIDESKKARFGYALISIGEIFYKGMIDGKRCLAGYADIQKTRCGVSIGQIEYKIYLEEKNEKVVIIRLKKRESDGETKTREELNTWRREEEEAFKKKLEDKGKAYLQLLSEEYTERERERGGLLTLKIQSYEEKEKKMEERLKELSDKEKAYETLKHSLAQENHNLEMEKMKILESCKMRIIQLSEKRKDENESHERRENEFQSEVNRLKEKINILEEKLKMRESEISELHTLRATWPDVNVTLRAEKLELINKELEGKFKDENKKKEEYKEQLRKMSQELHRAQKERDSQLLAENENLKLQIEANRARDLLAIEHRNVDNFGEELRHFQSRLEGTQKKGRDKNFNCSFEEGKKEKRLSTHNERNKLEDEIGRLMSVREEFLKTKAYTSTDMVIKQMDRKIVTLLDKLQ